MVGGSKEDDGSMTKVPEGVAGEPQRSLVGDLQARGFTILQERYDPQSFGNYLLDLTTKDFSVRIILDRGYWSVDASVPGWKDWIPLSMWRWIYEAGPLPGARSDFTVDARWLLATLEMLLTDLRRDPSDIHERLWECGRARMRALAERSRPNGPDLSGGGREA
jgi:hypothetical protein